MRRSRVAVCSLLVGAAGLVVAACGDDDDDEGPSQLPNPASVFCEEQGGTVELDTGICALPDGTRIDEWEYYRSEHGDVGIANPAAVFCEEQGGTISGPEPMCELPDGEIVDAWEYFRDNASG